MKFERQLRPATETSWVVSYGGKTIQRWQTAAILKNDISPYLSEKIIRFWWLRVRQNVFLVTVDSLKDADLRKDVPFGGLDDE